MSRPTLDGLDLWPDLPGYVHGIVCLDPPTVQCDGCGRRYSRKDLALAVLCSGIEFYTRSSDPRRLCRECAKHAGWDQRP